MGYTYTISFDCWLAVDSFHLVRYEASPGAFGYALEMRGTSDTGPWRVAASYDAFPTGVGAGIWYGPICGRIMEPVTFSVDYFDCENGRAAFEVNTLDFGLGVEAFAADTASCVSLPNT